MKKIDISLIEKYINKQDLGIYTKEELENNKDFMKAVIRYTNDEKFYGCCSNDLKKDYDFVKYVILKFRSYYDFIMSVADKYLEKGNLDVNALELNILMTKLLPNNLANKYELVCQTAYYAKRVEIEIAKAQDPNLESQIGEGFLFIFDDYSPSEIVLKYFAMNMIEEIIEDNDINWEIMVHNQFKTPDKIDEVGVNNYIINFIGYYDSMLSTYISTHLDLIKGIKNKIKGIELIWDRYNKINDDKRYNNMLDMVHEYMRISESNMEEMDLLYFVARELGVKDKVIKYVNPYIMIDNLDEKVITAMIKFDINRSLKERIVYLNVRKIMQNQLFSINPSDLYSIIENKIETNGQVQKLKPENNN